MYCSNIIPITVNITFTFRVSVFYFFKAKKKTKKQLRYCAMNSCFVQTRFFFFKFFGVGIDTTVAHSQNSFHTQLFLCKTIHTSSNICFIWGFCFFFWTEQMRNCAKKNEKGTYFLGLVFI